MLTTVLGEGRPQVNRYGQMAREHWSRFLPDRVAAIEDPSVFFKELGREVETRVTSLEIELAGPDPVGESHLEKVGRLMNARQRAEEVVLRELVLLPPEPGGGSEDEPEETSPERTSTSGWHSVQEDPNDPFWTDEDR